MTTAPVFHVPRERLNGPAVRLDGPEGRHAALVRRLQVGERLDLTDGAGLLAQCVVLRSAGQALDLEVLELLHVAAPDPRITVVQALPKSDRGETAVETMTEIGVDAIVPWSAARSITQWRGDRGAKSLAKWRSTAAEASKQARRAWWPEIDEVASTAKVAKLLASAAAPVLLHESAEQSLADLTLPPPPAASSSGGVEAAPTAREIVLVVGPEGGISPEELHAFTEAGGLPYRMGPTVLRTSTAGTAAAAVLLARSGRWN
ncbi:MAG TPA: 16S rRNA (uracil(1498)-N(3))-methyltransferase [Actinocrinis sp.]|jgi:16S rRNA (uracil1498-N3)-methyltransferase|uniref:16S rRNA (uracil(1498)-N(3))-methyltransferase n=1 Tax=Actinocrinis sp. TaxID=1920516 RepID=UPI002DDD4841|nr:16S rRNA (uracil(1498)-N(3))-methyltransferase [Actinocrinis sp.]HEV3173750.1 16S rRNA (uracil(1498)-N(3))-methyltransferase [Actinocrinis sp.]